MEAAEHLRASIARMLEAFEAGDSQRLRYESNRLIRHASLHGDRAEARLAMVAYCLHKLLTKEHIVRAARWPRHRLVLLRRVRAIQDSLERGEDALMEALDGFARQLDVFDRVAGRYVQSLWDKATIKYAADAYFRGVSLGRAAALTGAHRGNLQEYVGATRQKLGGFPEKGIAARLKTVKEALSWPP